MIDIQNLDAKRESYKYLVQVNNKCEWICNIYMKYGIITDVATMAGVCVVSIFASWMIYGNSDTEHLICPCQLA